MKYIVDFHIHSKYSRATSPQMNLEVLDEFARIKGINVLATGDFTHPEWFKNLKQKLEPAEQGLYKLKKNANKQSARFILTSEISCIYSKAGKVRKIHIIVLAPSLTVVEKINMKLAKIGNLKADGRPILGLDAKELTKIVLDVSKDCLVIPAHCMTPWFGLFGSKSGFDSMEECFEEYTKYIFAVETGLSADPSMLCRIPDIRNVCLLSNSDAHSPAKLGREANVFQGKEISYQAITQAIKNKSRFGQGQSSAILELLYTIEFYPQEGKYFNDGHRQCDVNLSSNESKKYNNICPNCGKPLTVGVMNRVEQISDKPQGFKSKNFVPFKSLIPLREIIAECVGTGVATKRVTEQYNNLIKNFENEFNILLNVSQSDLCSATLSQIAEGIIKARNGDINIEPGYDGVFGKIKIFSKKREQCNMLS
ncbi:MAG: endonuclease Q family protein [Patescibacteria group bacterium]|nr:endonuclease Q family protein [Patescibacteria group bacterium]